MTIGHVYSLAYKLNKVCSRPAADPTMIESRSLLMRRFHADYDKEPWRYVAFPTWRFAYLERLKKSHASTQALPQHL